MATLTGTPDNDLLEGTGEDDEIDGLAGADTMHGGGGNDVFAGALQPGDIIDGGDGYDRVIALDLSWAANDLYLGNEFGLSLYYTEPGAVVAISGVEGVSGVTAGAGNDHLWLGFAGDSFVTDYRGGPGTDTLKLDFSGNDGQGRSALAVTMEAPGADYTVLNVLLDDASSPMLRLYRDIEHFDITGGAGGDSLVGGTLDDTLRGGGGNDTLSGRDGNDLLDGGAGRDRLLAGAGDDLLYGGTGSDWLNGGTGTDVAVYYFSAHRVVVDLGAQGGSAGDALGDTLTGIEGVVGSTFSDRITGDAGANALHGGGAGADRIFGLGGDDVITADSGPVFPAAFAGQGLLTTGMSYFYGGAGNDTIWGATAHISSVDPAYYQPATIYGDDGDDALYNGLVVYGGDGNDYIYGGNIDSTLYGDAGADVIEATYGNHIVDAGTGNDLVFTEALHGGTNVVSLGGGNDLGMVLSYDPQFAHTFDGGAGTDTFLFECDNLSFTTLVSIDALEQPSGGHLGVVSVTNFERFALLLAGEHDDVVKLGNLGDWVQSSDGNDYVDGRGGADYLDGGYGVDTIFGGVGNDVVIAGSSPTGQSEVVRGGAGDDAVYGNFSSADYAGVAKLYGDAGHDVFSFLPAGIYTPDVVMDFNALDDHISLYAGAYYLVDPSANSFEPIAASNVVDTANVLRFTYTGRYGELEMHDVEVRYDRQSGVLSVRNADLPYVEWTKVATLKDAPAVDLSHFLTLPEVATPASIEAAYHADGLLAG